MSIVTNLRYTANLDKGVTMTPITPSFLGGDQEAHRFVIDCYRQNSREAVDLSGVGVTGYFIRADGVTIPIVGETENNQASVLLPAACYAKQGRFSLVIKLSLDDGTADSIATVFWGEGAVSRSRTDVVIDPDSVIPSLEELLAQIQAMEIATENANTAADNANQAATDATSTANAAAASAQATAEAAATQAVEIATAKGDEAVQVATEKGNEAVQIATEQVEAQNQAIAKIATDLLTKAPAIECAASGSLVTVTDAAAQPAVQLVTHIEPVQEGEGDPSPDNVRPISGWDKAQAQRVQKNVADASPGRVHSGYYTDNEGKISTNANYVRVDAIPVMPGTTYTISSNLEIYSVWFGQGDKRTSRRGVSSGNKVTMTTKANDNRLYITLKNPSGAADTTAFEWLQVELGSTATAYEPYCGQTLTADLPETVYGGTLDWGTGVLTVDVARFAAEENTKWTYATTSAGVPYVYVTTFARRNYEKMKCNLFPVGMGTVRVEVSGAAEDGYLQFVLQGTGITTAEDWGAWAAANGLEVVYPIPAPYTIQLTPQQLSMLRGTTNLWSDTGDTDLVYVADTEKYVKRIIKEALQNATTEE